MAFMAAAQALTPNVPGEKYAPRGPEARPTDPMLIGVSGAVQLAAGDVALDEMLTPGETLATGFGEVTGIGVEFALLATCAVGAGPAAAEDAVPAVMPELAVPPAGASGPELLVFDERPRSVLAPVCDGLTAS